MGTTYSAILMIVITAAVINLFMAIFVLSHRSNQIIPKVLATYCLLVTMLAGSSAFQLTANTMLAEQWWILIQYLLKSYLPFLAFVSMCYYYNHEAKINYWRMAFLFLIPNLTAIIFLVCDINISLHLLLHRSIGYEKVTVEGVMFLIQGIYTAIAIIGSFICLLLQWKRTNAMYRTPFFLILISFVPLFAVEYMYWFNLSENSLFVIPVILTFTVILYVCAFAYRGMFQVAPIARDQLFQSMVDAVVVLDNHNRIVDYNEAAATFIPALSADAIGKPIQPLVKEHTDAPLWDEKLIISNKASASRAKRHRLEAKLYHPQEVKWKLPDGTHYMHIRSSVIRKNERVVTGKLIVMIDVTERTKMQQQLKQLAYYDGMTGIYKREQFLNKGQQLLEDTYQLGQPYTVILMDVDRFKRINDTYGHQAGDEALRHFVQCCQMVLRTNDLFARYGGEEFIIALPYIAAEEAATIAERLRNKFAVRPLEMDNQELFITASFGVAYTNNEMSLTLSQLIVVADRALYRAKQLGRDRVVIAEKADYKDVF